MVCIPLAVREMLADECMLYCKTSAFLLKLDIYVWGTDRLALLEAESTRLREEDSMQKRHSAIPTPVLKHVAVVWGVCLQPNCRYPICFCQAETAHVSCFGDLRNHCSRSVIHSSLKTCSGVRDPRHSIGF